MITFQMLRPFLTFTAATLSSLTFTSLIDCQPSLFWWDLWHGGKQGNKLTDFYRNKNIWIIGASSGIGQELALQLVQAGCASLILSARNQGQLQKVADACSSSQRGGDCQCYCRTLDVLNTQGGEELALRFEDFIQNQLPKSTPIDIVIFNAGAGQLQPSLETPPNLIQRIMDVNALWPMILTPLLFKHAVFRSLCMDDNASTTPNASTASSSGVPHIVVTNSIAAQLPVPLSAVYAASKAAQAQYFRSLATEQPDQSVRVDVICPGPVSTDFHQNHKKLSEKAVKETTNNDDNHHHDSSHAETSEVVSKSSTKMSVTRCARLMVSSMARKTSHAYQEIWLAPSPLISVLYVQRLFPGLFQRLTTKFGQKRAQLWREGKDLYDPKSWK